MFGGSKRSKGIRVESNWCTTVQTGKKWIRCNLGGKVYENCCGGEDSVRQDGMMCCWMLDDILEKDKLWSKLDEVGVVTGNSGHVGEGIKG